MESALDKAGIGAIYARSLKEVLQVSNMKWKDAIEKVLSESDEPMHYTDVAEAIVESGLRSQVGATPKLTVGSVLTTSLQSDGDSSPFVRMGKGYYALRERASAQAASRRATTGEAKVEEEPGLINAFGMYWSRDKVHWATKPRLLGQQQFGSKQVDFAEQKGVYLLHDVRGVVYVGRTTDRPLGIRLREHTADRLNSRWDRFSWFGVCPVSEDGSLLPPPTDITTGKLIVTMEALLIEGLEPPQNSRRGDDFRAAEFLQVADPEIKISQMHQLVDELK